MANTLIISVEVAFMLLVLIANKEVEGGAKKPAKKTGAAGGVFAGKPPDAKMKGLIERLKPALKNDIAQLSTGQGNHLTAGHIDKLDLVSYREQQVVYIVKLLVNEGKKQSYWHAVIFEEEQKEILMLEVVEGPKEAPDPLQ